MRFEPGRTVLRRFFQRGEHPNVVKSVRVVGDDERGLLLWVADGSPLAWLRPADGRSMHGMPLPEWLAAPKHLSVGPGRAAASWC